jgi:signal transduction histidine kinase
MIHLNAEKNGTSTIITVEDNGAGMPQEHVASIFNWSSIRSDSSGLGLRLAKEFAEKLNGSIAVHSVEKKGTTFSLTFKG